MPDDETLSESTVADSGIDSEEDNAKATDSSDSRSSGSNPSTRESTDASSQGVMTADEDPAADDGVDRDKIEPVEPDPCLSSEMASEPTSESARDLELTAAGNRTEMARQNLSDQSERTPMDLGTSPVERIRGGMASILKTLALGGIDLFFRLIKVLLQLLFQVLKFLGKQLFARVTGKSSPDKVAGASSQNTIRYLGKIPLLNSILSNRLGLTITAGVMISIVLITTATTLFPSTSGSEIVPAPTAAPEPEENLGVGLERSPERSLIAEIQDQVAEMTSQVADGLIQTIQANFRDSVLTVNLTADWYQLSALRQDEVANEILQQSIALDFQRIQLVDPAGAQLARNPVVGEQMVILRRQDVSAQMD